MQTYPLQAQSVFDPNVTPSKSLSADQEKSLEEQPSLSLWSKVVEYVLRFLGYFISLPDIYQPSLQEEGSELTETEGVSYVQQTIDFVRNKLTSKEYKSVVEKLKKAEERNKELEMRLSDFNHIKIRISSLQKEHAEQCAKLEKQRCADIQVLSEKAFEKEKENKKLKVESSLLQTVACQREGRVSQLETEVFHLKQKVSQLETERAEKSSRGFTRRVIGYFGF